MIRFLFPTDLRHRIRRALQLAPVPRNLATWAPLRITRRRRMLVFA